MIFAVYGTLKQGYGNHYLLQKAKYIGLHTTEPKYSLFDGGFPIVERDGSHPVVVELYESNDEKIINKVHALEGCTGIQNHPNNWYDFDYIQTPKGEARMFVMNKGKSKRNRIIHNGNWQQ